MALLLVAIAGPSMAEQAPGGSYREFSAELEAIAQRFSIPGMAALVVRGSRPSSQQVLAEHYVGFSDPERIKAVDAATLFPIASLTKVYSAVVIAKLAEQGLLSMEDPVHRWLPAMTIDPRVKLKHLLSHTSQGTPGQHFYYSGRYSAAGLVAEKASGLPFAQLLERELLEPFSLKDTHLYQQETFTGPLLERLATPHVFDRGNRASEQEFGVSAAAGLVATPREVVAFGQALLQRKGLKSDTFDTLLRPLTPSLPCAMGIFIQQVGSYQVWWSYGQYDGFSALWVMVPDLELQLVVMGNNNLTSDAARLINADVTTSPWMVSFIKHFFPSDDPKLSVDHYLAKSAIMTHAFMARFDDQSFAYAKAVIDGAFKSDADWLAFGDLNLLHGVSFLKTVAQFKNLPAVSRWDRQLVSLGERLLVQQPDNPYARYYLAEHFSRSGQKAKAAQYYQAIVDEPNFTEHWYTREAKAWLQANGEFP